MSQARASDDLLAKMKHLHPLMIDLSLERIEQLLVKLGAPETKLAPVVHIAGTNGKGSVTAFLKAMLEAADLRVGAYTSPHLINFHERIVVPPLSGTAGTGGSHKSRPISEEKLVELLSHVLEVNGDDAITFFEITTAVAFLAFTEHPCDVILLEVGLGGRFDTTNVVKSPALTIITPVSMDHADKLGATIAKIAREKAGILKPEVPAVIAAQPEDALQVIKDIAGRVAAPLCLWGRDFDAYEQNGRLIYQGRDRLLDLVLPSLNGRHQILNAGVAVAGALQLRQQVSAIGDVLSDAAIERGLVEARWPARLQRLTDLDGPLRQPLSPMSELWLDGGHNEAAGLALAQAMADLEERAPKPLVLIIGMMGQKDAARFLTPFMGLARHVIAVPIDTAEEATHDPDALATIAAGLGFIAETAADAGAALKRATTLVDEPLRALICGSLYLAGNILAQNQGAKRGPPGFEGG